MNLVCDPQFLPLLEPFDDIDIQRSPHVVYGVWADFRLAFLNPAWFLFATENYGDPAVPEHWSVGRSLLDAIPSELAPFYQEKFQACLASGKHWSHEYECSSDAVYRKYHQTTYPLSDRGLLVVNSLLVEVPLADAGVTVPEDPDLHAYYDERRCVHQCCHCRRVKHQDREGQWDFVPLFIRRPEPRTTHGLCSHCLNHYYPEAKPYL